MGAPKGCKQPGRVYMGSDVEMPWLALGGAASVLLGINGLRNKPSQLVEPPAVRLAFPKSLTGQGN